MRCGSDSNVHQRRKTIALEFKKDSCYSDTLGFGFLLQVDTPLHLLPSRASTGGGGLGIDTRNRLDVGTPHSFAGDGAHHKWRKQYLHGDTYKQRSQAAVPEVRWKLGDYTVSYGAQRDAPARSLERVHEGSQQVCVTARRDVMAEACEGDEVGGGLGDGGDVGECGRGIEIWETGTAEHSIK